MIRSGEVTRLSRKPCNPFPTDIYYLGNVIRKMFLERTRGEEFMQLLVANMVHEDPSQRPTIQQVTSNLDAIMKSLGSRKLRSRSVYVGEDTGLRLVRTFGISSSQVTMS